MTTTSDPIAASMQAADPLVTRAPVDPGLVADLEAAWTRIAATPAPEPLPRRRRVLLLAVAAAVVVAVGVPLTLPARGPVTPPYAHAVTLDQLVANARAVSGPVLRITTMHEWIYGGVSTPEGPAYYRYDHTYTQSIAADGGFTTYAVAKPLQWLTPTDAARGASTPADRLPGQGTTRDSVVLDWPTAADIAALPADPDRLLAAVPVVCGDGTTPVCVVTDVLPVLEYPGSTAAQRAAVLEVLARQDGVTVLGPRDVAGHHGIAVRFREFPLEVTEVTMVFDATDGSVLSTTYVRKPDDTSLFPVPVGAVVGESVRVF